MLAPSWRVLGPFWLQVGGSWGHFGSKLEVIEAMLAPSWGSWGPSWIQVRGLGAMLAPSWRVLGLFCLQLGDLGSNLWGVGANLGSKLGVTLAPVCHFAEIAKSFKKNISFLRVF